MADEWRHIAVGDGVSDSGVDEVSEEGDAIDLSVILYLKAN